MSILELKYKSLAEWRNHYCRLMAGMTFGVYGKHTYRKGYYLTIKQQSLGTSVTTLCEHRRIVDVATVRKIAEQEGCTVLLTKRGFR